MRSDVFGCVWMYSGPFRCVRIHSDTSMCGREGLRFGGGSRHDNLGYSEHNKRTVTWTFLDMFGHAWTFSDIVGHSGHILGHFRTIRTFLNILGHFRTFPVLSVFIYFPSFWDFRTSPIFFFGSSHFGSSYFGSRFKIETIDGE